MKTDWHKDGVLLAVCVLAMGVFACCPPPPTPPESPDEPVCADGASDRTEGCDEFARLSAVVEKNGTVQNDDDWHPLDTGDTLATDENGEAELNFSDCWDGRLYLFDNSSGKIRVRDCHKADYNADNLWCVPDGTWYSDRCRGEFSASTGSVVLTKLGTSFSITALPEDREISLVVVLEGRVMVEPVLSYDPTELGEALDVPGGEFYFTMPDVMLSDVAGLEPRVAHPVDELEPVAIELGIVDWMIKVRDRAEEGGVLPDNWPVLVRVYPVREVYAEPETIKIGLDMPMTGDMSYLGTQSQRAAGMMAADVNDADGLEVGGERYTIELITRDNESTAEEATAVATTLITEDRVLAIIGPQASRQAVPAGGVANEYETPMISPFSTDPNTTLNRPWVFRACFLDISQGPVVADFAAEYFGFIRAAVLYDVASDWPRRLAESFRDGWEAIHGAGSVVAFESFTTGDTDFSAPLTRIEASGAEFIFTPQFYNEVPLIVRQAQELGLEQVIIGPDSWADPRMLELCGDACEGSYFSTHYAAEGATGPTKEFIERYEEAFGETPGDAAALTWDAMGILLQAIQNTGGLTGDLAANREAVKDELGNIKDFMGVTGGITSFTPEGDPIKCAVIATIEGGMFSFYDWFCP